MESRPSPGVIVVRPVNAPGPRLEVRAGSMTGRLLFVVVVAGPPGAAGRPDTGIVICAPAVSPAGCRRHLRDESGADAGYLEYRSHLSAARCVTALVGPGDDGVLAWTRERAVLPALRRRIMRNAPVPATAVMIGQVEAGSIDAVPGLPGAYRLVWGRGPRLATREAAILATAVTLPR